MTPETHASIINLGAAGAVIIVVNMFLRNIEKRDADWQSFFNTLNSSNAEDTKQNTEILKKLVEDNDCIKGLLIDHDKNVEDRVKSIQIASRARKIKAE